MALKMSQLFIFNGFSYAAKVLVVVGMFNLDNRFRLPWMRRWCQWVWRWIFTDRSQQDRPYIDGEMRIIVDSGMRTIERMRGSRLTTRICRETDDSHKIFHERYCIVPEIENIKNNPTGLTFYTRIPPRFEICSHSSF